MAHAKNHDYHILHPSIYPFIGAIGGFVMLSGAAFWMKGSSPVAFFIGLALVLFTIYAAMDPHHFDSWTLIGAASRAMIDLGIHQDPSRNVVVSKGKLEIRRRVYWCVYAIDRYVNVSSVTWLY